MMPNTPQERDMRKTTDEQAPVNGDTDEDAIPLDNPPTVVLIDTTNLRLLPVQHARIDDFLEWYKSMILDAQPFRFLELAAEIRNHIYSLTFSDSGETVDLTTHALPVTSRVSRQLRQESLPLFFAETPFHVTIDCNFHALFHERLLAQNGGLQKYHDPRPAARARCGRLRFKQAVKTSVRLATGSALFRNVTLKICWSGINGVNRANLKDEDVTAFITLRVGGPNGTDIRVSEGERYPSSSGPPQYEKYSKQDADHVLNKAQEIIDKIRVRAAFNGFTLNDLERIAKPFRIRLSHEGK